MRTRSLFILAALSLICPAARAQVAPDKVLPTFKVVDGLQLELFAADADFGGKPIAMTWDERGRLWVAVTVDYPNELKKPGEGRDKILLCEDTNGDGRADKFTVFADKLSIPTSLLCVYGGLLVTQAPHTLFLKDTDGDGVADLRQVLMDGWNTRDTHAGPSNLRYGHDNWMYGIVGYSGFNGTVGGEEHRFNQGLYRFRPDGSKLEFLRGTNNNSWGVGLSEEGLVFGSTANGCASVFLPIPNRYYEGVRGWTSSVWTPAGPPWSCSAPTPPARCPSFPTPRVVPSTDRKLAQQNALRTAAGRVRPAYAVVDALRSAPLSHLRPGAGTA